MNPSPPNTTANSGEGAGPGSASNMNATLNPPAMQTLQQVVLDGVSVSDVDGLSATSQHAGRAHNTSLGMQPPQMFSSLVATQMKQFVERRGPAQVNHERMDQWSGTITWWGTDTTRNETRELRAQITATASKGDPLVSTWPDALLLAPAGPAVSTDELHEWMRHSPVVMQIQPTPGTDEHGYGQLVKLLGYKSCYAIAGWEIPGKGHSMNLFIALSTLGLIGAAFPTTGIPEIPKPQLTHLDPAVHSVGGNSIGINPRATLKTAVGIDERASQQWSGTLTWQGTNTTLGERTKVRAQVTASASEGDPWASTWPNVLSLAPAGPAVSMDELHDWMRKYSPVVTHIEPTAGTNGHSCGQLVKLLRDKSCYAVAGWRIPGMAHSTMNLLIAPFSQGLLGAVFPITGMPEIPKPRLPQLDPGVRKTIFNLLPPPIRSMPEPQLSQAIMQIFVSQKHRFNAVQGGVCSLT
ncbi:hypothetical protein V8E52_004162 [Russula decolorans]